MEAIRMARMLLLGEMLPFKPWKFISQVPSSFLWLKPRSLSGVGCNSGRMPVWVIFLFRWLSLVFKISPRFIMPPFNFCSQVLIGTFTLLEMLMGGRLTNRLLWKWELLLGLWFLIESTPTRHCPQISVSCVSRDEWAFVSPLEVGEEVVRHIWGGLGLCS